MRSLVAAIAICGLATAAHADRAEQLFKKGKKLLAEKKYPEACTAFEQSDRLDPGIGAKLNVAKCYEDWGKLATAWRWYTDAEQMATSAKDDRAKKIHALIEALDPGVPRLTVSLPPGAITDDLVVKLDGVELALAELGSERRVDPGLHQVDTVVGGATQSKVASIERGDKVEISLAVPVRPRPRLPTEPAPTPEDPRTRKRRLIGLGLSGAGGAAIGVAAIVTLRARGDFKHALDEHCNGANDMCDDIGQRATRGARRRANISTGITVGGVAAIATGLYLYFTASRGRTAERAQQANHALYFTPVVGGGDGTGLVLGGAF